MDEQELAGTSQFLEQRVEPGHERTRRHACTGEAFTTRTRRKRPEPASRRSDELEDALVVDLCKLSLVVHQMRRRERDQGDVDAVLIEQAEACVELMALEIDLRVQLTGEP